MLAASQPALPPWKQIQLPPQAVPARQALGTYFNIVMAPQPLGPLGPMARGLLTTTGTQGLDLILSQAQKTNVHEVPFFYSFHLNNTTLECLPGSRSSGQRPTHQPLSKPTRIHCKTASLTRLVFETRAKCQDFVARYKDDGIHQVDSPFCNSSTNITVRQSTSLEDREIGRGLRRCGKLWSQSFMKSSLNEMLKIFSLSLHLTHVHKSSAFWSPWGNQFSSLHHPDTNSRLILLLLTCAFLAFLMIYCDRSFVTPAIWLRTVLPRSFSSSPFRRLAS